MTNSAGRSTAGSRIDKRRVQLALDAEIHRRKTVTGLINEYRRAA